MDQLFPFGFPFHTGLYVAVYCGTLLLHFVFMNYVLAGSAVVAVALLCSGRTGKAWKRSPMIMVLCDWLPFALGAAITAGVAPILFVQLLYKTNFYTANLLLLHRWMAIVPVLIVGFYLLYLLKSQKIAEGRRWLRVIVGCGAFACFLFTAFSWVENHLLSVASTEWPLFYTSGRWMYSDTRIALRLGIWLFSAFPTMSALVGWQLWCAGRSGSVNAGAGELRRVALIATGGLLASCICVVWYGAQLGDAERAAVMTHAAIPYAYLGIAGVVAQLVGWIGLFVATRSGSTCDHDRIKSSRWLGLASAGCFFVLVSGVVLRELLRSVSVDFEALVPAHERVATAGGFGVFVGFLGLNAVLVGASLAVVRRGSRRDVGGA